MEVRVNHSVWYEASEKTDKVITWEKNDVQGTILGTNSIREVQRHRGNVGARRFHSGEVVRSLGKEEENGDHGSEAPGLGEAAKREGWGFSGMLMDSK